MIRWLSLCAAGLLLINVANGDESRDQSLELFEKKIRPALVEHCQRCHGAQKQQGNLRLDSREGWDIGGDNGAAIIPGDVGSLLLTAIRYEDSNLEMPPKGKLPNETIQAFERWVALGAIDPRQQSHPKPETDANMSPSVEQAKSFWSFQPITAPEVPDVTDADWPAGDIDRFVLARLEQNALNPSPSADPQTLFRRIHYDLIGLPPTPEQVAQFLADPSPQAYEQTVTRLLASPEFGQRWGRHWLDVVRFAESSGGGRTLLFPEAWRYRDYVIESFNDDVPFDQFVTQQIAGDLLPSNDWQQRCSNLVATGFLLLGPTNYEMQDKDVLEMDVVDEQLDTIGKAFLGMTIGCARCHDHKFDPIPASDYYALAGILKSSRSLEHANVSKWSEVGLPLSPEELRRADHLSNQLKEARRQAAELRQRWLEAGGKPQRKPDEKSIQAMDINGIVVDDPQSTRVGQWNESQSNAYFVGEHYLYDSLASKSIGEAVFRPTISRAGRYEIRVCYSPGANRSTRVPVHIDHAGGRSTVTVNQRQKPTIDGMFESLGFYQLDPDTAQVVVACEGTNDGVVVADAVIFIPDSAEQDGTDDRRVVDDSKVMKLKQALDSQLEQIQTLEGALPKPPLAMVIAEHDQPGDIHLAIRGVTHAKGELTKRGVLQAASWQEFPEIPAAQSGRKELADWIVDQNNPLTARVVVNRVWYWLIGQGIVTSVDNFGSMGQRPSHPQLLDHLAVSLVEDQWSIKRLIHRIVMSRTYQQCSDVSTAARSIDPDNRLLWRMNRKRLRAESIRDSLLLVSGQLDARHGGSNIKSGTKREYGYQFDSTRRSVYVPVFRNALPEIFEVFDFADPNIQNGKRSSSTVSSQALLMMNHPFVIEQARMAAERNLMQPRLDGEARIEFAYREVIGRPPSNEETQVALDLLSDPAASLARADRDHPDRNPSDQLALLYQVLFQCIDFRYVK